MSSLMEETNCENLCEASAYEFSTIEILPSLILCFIIQYFMISAHGAAGPQSTAFVRNLHFILIAFQKANLPNNDFLCSLSKCICG